MNCTQKSGHESVCFFCGQNRVETIFFKNKFYFHRRNPAYSSIHSPPPRIMCSPYLFLWLKIGITYD